MGKELMSIEQRIDTLRTHGIPREVTEAIGTVMSPPSVVDFWHRRNPLLSNRAPSELWNRGERTAVIDFIQNMRAGVSVT